MRRKNLTKLFFLLQFVLTFESVGKGDVHMATIIMKSFCQTFVSYLFPPPKHTRKPNLNLKVPACRVKLIGCQLQRNANVATS